jgi:hypothetical protein
MPCDFPKHHGSSGGGWGGPIAAIFTAMILAAVLGPLLHWLEIALACVGIAAAITVGLTVRRRWRQRQALPPGRYVPWMPPSRQHPQLGGQQPSASLDGGQHLHLHLGGLTPAERAEVMRQLLEDQIELGRDMRAVRPRAQRWEHAHLPRRVQEVIDPRATGAA